jgi:hypothetical protein
MRKVKIVHINEENSINRYNRKNLQDISLNLRSYPHHIQFVDKADNLKDSQFVGLGKSTCDGLIQGFGIIEMLEGKDPYVYTTSQDFDCIYPSKIILKGMKEHLLL